MGGEQINKEVRRKLFHLLTLIYLYAYHLLGMERFLWMFGVWVFIIAVVEGLRLAIPRLNELLIRYFQSVHRKEEIHHISGMLYTALGCWLTVVLFGTNPQTVNGAILFLAFGDAAAALVGTYGGRHSIGIGGKRRSLEGSLSCLAACLVCGYFLSLPAFALVAGSLAATSLEFAPLPFNDNFWMPLGTATVLWYCT